MKKLLALVLILLLLAGCTAAQPPAPEPLPEPLPEPKLDTTATPEPDPLQQLRETIARDGSICGIAFLGRCEGSYQKLAEYFEQDGIFRLFPFLEDLPAQKFVQAAGEELYLVVPARAENTLTVQEAFLNEPYGGEVSTTLLFEGENCDFLLLQGNQSEVFANLILSLETEGEKLGYSPYMSLKDGMLAGAYPPVPSVCDLTPYEIVLPGLAAAAASDWVGSWYSIAGGEEGMLVLSLTMNSDGSAVYSYGPPSAGVAEYFEGSWSEDKGMLSLSMYGGPVSFGEEDVGGYYFDGRFSWYMQGEHLLLTHESGTPLFLGGSGVQLRFLDFDASQLSGIWNSESADDAGVSTACMLSLEPDGTALLERQGETQQRFGGSWRQDGELLTLFLRAGDISLVGGYTIEYTDGGIYLLWQSGDPLTPFMAQSGWELFSPAGVG